VYSSVFSPLCQMFAPVSEMFIDTDWFAFI
jgi:hypothetical protein